MGQQHATQHQQPEPDAQPAAESTVDASATPASDVAAADHIAIKHPVQQHDDAEPALAVAVELAEADLAVPASGSGATPAREPIDLDL